MTHRVFVADVAGLVLVLVVVLTFEALVRFEWARWQGVRRRRLSFERRERLVAQREDEWRRAEFDELAQRSRPPAPRGGEVGDDG